MLDYLDPALQPLKRRKRRRDSSPDRLPAIHDDSSDDHVSDIDDEPAPTAMEIITLREDARRNCDTTDVCAAFTFFPLGTNYTEDVLGVAYDAHKGSL